MSENFYNILGINEKATKEEIKKAYRNLQMKYHPDKNNGCVESKNISMKINEAYETLGNEQKRAEYDMIRNNPNPFMRMNSHNNNGHDINMDDIFSMFFSGGASPFNMGGFPGMPPGVHVFHGGIPGGPMGIHQAMSKPPPIIKTINVNLDQAFTGTTISLDIERWIVENGIQIHENETIYVNVPKGIDDNEIIILRDKGNVLNENVKGDVKIFVKIVNETIFKRSGLDLILEKNIHLKDALCGCTFEIKHLNNKIYSLNNNKGNVITPEYKKIYPNMGLTRDEHTGNLIIHFHIDFPDKLTDEQINKFLEAFSL